MDGIRILGINGSPRRANSDLLLEAALAAAAAAGGVETEAVELRRETIGYCTGCFGCNEPNDRPSGCRVHADGMDRIAGLLLACDGLILVSPVYFGGVTAQMKTFMDRTEPLLRYAPAPRTAALRNKVGAGIAVGGNRNGGQESTLQAMHHFFAIHDMVIAGTGPDLQPGCYLGGAAFSGMHPQLGSRVRDAVRGDELGLRAAGIIGRRVAELARRLRAGGGVEDVSRNCTGSAE